MNLTVYTEPGSIGNLVSYLQFAGLQKRDIDPLVIMDP